MKRWIWPFFRKVFIFIGILAVLIFGAGKVNWEQIENWAFEKMARHEPFGEQQQSPLFTEGRVSVSDTVAYKKEQYLIFKTNIKNTVKLLASKVGFKSHDSNQNLSSISEEITKNSQFKDLNFNYVALENDQSKVSEGASTDWDIIKTNLKDGFSALQDMITVRVMTENGEPMLVKVVDNKPVLVEYDSSDKIMRWGKEIQAASTKYGIDPAIIAAVIEQESGAIPMQIALQAQLA